MKLFVSSSRYSSEDCWSSVWLSLKVRSSSILTLSKAFVAVAAKSGLNWPFSVLCRLFNLKPGLSLAIGIVPSVCYFYCFSFYFTCWTETEGKVFEDCTLTFYMTPDWIYFFYSSLTSCCCLFFFGNSVRFGISYGGYLPMLIELSVSLVV